MARVVGISTDIKDSKEESQFVVCENFLSPNCGQDTFITKARVFVLFYFRRGLDRPNFFVYKRKSAVDMNIAGDVRQR